MGLAGSLVYWVHLEIRNIKMERCAVVLAVGFLLCSTASISRTAATQFLFDSLHGPSTTTISPYISDYRKQSRSDSRADKPDSFPGFDAAGNAPRRRRTHHRSAAEFYTHLFGRIIGNIGLDNIVDRVERKHDKLQRLSMLAKMRHSELGDGLLILKGLRHPETTTSSAAAALTTTTEFVGLSLDDEYVDYDAEDGRKVVVVKESLRNYDTDEEGMDATRSGQRYTLGSVPAVFAIPGRYVSSLWTHIFANQLRGTVAEQRRKQQQHESTASTTTMIQQQHKLEEVKIVEPATATTYLIQPLRSIWESVLATKSYYVNWPNPQMKSGALRVSEANAAPAVVDDSQQMESMHTFANDGIYVRSSNGTNGNRIQQKNQLELSTPSDSAPATDIPGSDVAGHKIIPSRIRSKLVRAKLAFQNAFNKYSNISNQTRQDKMVEPAAAATKTTMRRPMAIDTTTSRMPPSRSAGTNDDNDAAIESGFHSQQGDNNVDDVDANTIAPGDEAANLNNNAIDANVFVVVDDGGSFGGGGGRGPVVADGVVIVERRRVEATTHIYGDPQNNKVVVPDETNQPGGRRVEVGRGGAVEGDNTALIKGGGGDIVTGSNDASTGSKTVGADDYDDGDDDDADDDEAGGSSIGETFESVGIFVLEIFGTLLGLGWGAFNQIQYLFS